jgi:hypothetical protein
MGIDPYLQPLKPTGAKTLARDVAENGIVELTAHAKDEMAKDHLEATDCLNLIRAGVFEAPEYENGEWRYRSCTMRMCIVFTFISDTRLKIITAWRNG